MRKLLVAGNWKMHGSRADNAALIAALSQGLPAERDYEVLVCPPFVYLADLAEPVAAAGIALGAQNLSQQPQGAFTGEVAGSMVREVGADYVIVGHSERRALYAEDDATVAAKFVAAREHGLVPILCVGETLDEREQGATEDVIHRQLQAVVNLAGIAAFATAVIAYEPVWAIGTGRTASPEQAQEVHAYLRARLDQLDARIAGSIRLLYGGSVKAANAGSLFTMADVDGGLIGGAALKAEDFIGICAAAGNTQG